MSSILISDVMTKSPVCVESSSSLEAALAIMKEQGFQHIPVLKKGKVEGVVSIRDLELTVSLYGNLGARGAVSVGDVDNKTEALCLAAPEETLKSVAQRMAEKKVSAALVLDGDNVVGIFTATDAYQWIASVA